MSNEKANVDIAHVVVGAGVVGLAVARALALAGREVWVLEQADRPGEGISSRNSGVIHAGLYYPTGSLKARLCVRGRQLLYDYCRNHHVAHQRLGKLVVACNSPERDALQSLSVRATANGVTELRWLEAEQARQLEPVLQCVAALESPDSGIVDVPELVLTLVGEIEGAGGRVINRTCITGAQRDGQIWRLHMADGESLSCCVLINAAGLGAVELARAIVGFDPQHIPRIWFAAGHYYALRARAPFQRLIYPIPMPSGLGVHLGFDLAGRSRLGPDVRWLATPDYRFDDSQRAPFLLDVQRWWPALQESDIHPDFVGVRPKLSGPAMASADFCIQGVDQHGMHGLINLFGIDSPGLTSCLALGEEVLQRIQSE